MPVLRTLAGWLEAYVDRVRMEMQNPNMKRPSVAILPDQLTELLACIGSKLEQQQSIQSELGRALHALNDLPASTVVKAERQISDAAKLHHYWRRPKPSFGYQLGQAA